METCLIEDQKADAIIATVRSLLKSFKIKVYDEDTGYGLLRYVLIRKAEFTDEIMVVLVTASPVFPSKRNFVEALRREHPEITTVVQNVNDGRTALCWAASIRCSGAKATLWTGSAVVALRFRPAPFIRSIPFRLRSFMKKRSSWRI